MENIKWLIHVTEVPEGARLDKIIFKEIMPKLFEN